MDDNDDEVLHTSLLSWPSNPAKLRQSVYPTRLFPSRYAKRVCT